VPPIEVSENGLYCSAGGFYIDPWGPVDRAIVTHAHNDHASPGSSTYLTASDGAELLRARVGPEPAIEEVAYGKRLTLGETTVSLHPAGHILGSAQVRIEHRGGVCVVSGDYKRDADPSCAPFEPLRCDTFVTESTFGLPVFRWPPVAEVVESLHAWWRENQAAGRPSVLFAYPMGKAQRVLTLLDASIGPVLAHGAVERISAIYRHRGISVPPVAEGADVTKALVIAPPSARGTPWMRRFRDASTAFASGWMRIRGTRRRRSLDRGFVISDHADWPALLGAIAETGAETILATHGYTAPLVRWLQEHGRGAEVLQTRFGEAQDAPAEAEA
jgi:putative mRNA 3-end processing factor